MARKKKNDIELSPKYGLNPCMKKCFWCGEVDSVAILGRLRNGVRGGDFEAPKEAVMDLNPCPKCAETFKKCVLVIEATADGSEYKNNPNFQIKSKTGIVYPTGRFVGLDPSCVPNGTPGQTVLCDKETMDKIIEKTKCNESESENE